MAIFNIMAFNINMVNNMDIMNMLINCYNNLVTQIYSINLSLVMQINFIINQKDYLN